MRLTRSVLVLAFACCLSGCNSNTRGSGNIKTETRSVSDFNSVEVAGSAKLIIEQGDMEALSITADDNLLEYLASDVKDSKLTLGTEGFVSMSPTAPITYTLTVKKLTALGASGEIIVDARDLRTDTLAIAVNGSGDITLSGEASEQKIAIAGSADYKAEGFKTKDTSINITGSGKAVVAVSNRLDVQISGSGDVRYIGNPEVTQSISGSGSVEAWKP